MENPTTSLQEIHWLRMSLWAWGCNNRPCLVWRRHGLYPEHLGWGNVDFFFPQLQSLFAEELCLKFKRKHPVSVLSQLLSVVYLYHLGWIFPQ